MLQPNLSPQEFGLWFESQLLSLLRKSKRCYAHPLVDTRTAGNIVNPQPSDIMVVSNGKAVYVECKSSTADTDFNQCYRSHIRKEQAAAGRMIIRNSGRYVFPFLSRTDATLYFYDGDAVIARYHRNTGADVRLEPMLESSWAKREQTVNEFLTLMES